MSTRGPRWRVAFRCGRACRTRRRRACVGATRPHRPVVPLMILTRDVYGNITDSVATRALRQSGGGGGGGTVSAEAMGGGDGVRRDGGIEIHVVGGEGRVPVEALGEGRYESAVVSPVAGLLRVAVTIAGLHLRGSPFELQVNAERARPELRRGHRWQHPCAVAGPQLHHPPTTRAGSRRTVRSITCGAHATRAGNNAQQLRMPRRQLRARRVQHQCAGLTCLRNARAFTYASRLNRRGSGFSRTTSHSTGSHQALRTMSTS